MKNLFKFASVLLGLSVVLFFTSCQKEALTEDASIATPTSIDLKMEEYIKEARGTASTTANFEGDCRLLLASASGVANTCDGPTKVSVRVNHRGKGAFKITTPEGNVFGVIDGAYPNGPSGASLYGHATGIDNRPVRDPGFFLPVTIELFDSPDGDYVEFTIGFTVVIVPCDDCALGCDDCVLTLAAMEDCFGYGPNVVSGNVNVRTSGCEYYGAS